MTERLRAWVNSEVDTLLVTLEQLNIELSRLRAINTAASATVQSRAITYTRNLAQVADKKKLTLDTTRSTAKTLTNALLALGDNQVIIADRFNNAAIQIETLTHDLNTLRSEILRELTKLRNTAAAAQWNAQPQLPNCGTYFDTAAAETD